MRSAVLTLTAVTFALAGVCAAQTSPPTPNTNPQTKPGGTIVVNPTEAECKQGWKAGMRWTKDQFDEFCSRLGASK